MIIQQPLLLFFFFFNDTATPEIYTLSLHDALPISPARRNSNPLIPSSCAFQCAPPTRIRSEEHTSELQSPYDLVCRLLLEKKKKYSAIKNTLITQTHTSATLQYHRSS